MLSLCRFFGMELHACRPHKPKDKGTVEAAVKIVTRSALAKMRYQITNGKVKYSSVSEVNKALQPLIESINNHEVRALKLSRKELFAQERKLLRVPESWDYSDTESYVQTVPSNGVIELGKHQYALPPKWIGNSIVVETYPKVVRFLSHNRIIASYERRDEVTGLSAQPSFYTDERLLSFERYRLEQDDFLLQWAAVEGNEVKAWAALRKSEAVKQVVKILSLAKGCTNLYNCINNSVVQSRVYLGYPAVTERIIKAFEANAPQYDGPLDEQYSLDKYDFLCKEVIYGRLPLLRWPTCADNQSHRQQSAGEYLQGAEVIKQRYEHVSNVLNTNVKEAC